MAIYIAVAAFILFDILTGLIKALYKHNLNSTLLRKGLYNKLSEIVAMFGGGLLEYGASYINLGFDMHIKEIVAVYICAMELVSILENISMVNPSFKKLFKSYLDKLKQETEEPKNDTEKRY